LQIVQISDIHIGGLFVQSVFDTVVDEVNSLKPDAIIVTGDLTDDGLMIQFEAISNYNEYLEPLILVLAKRLSIHLNTSCIVLFENMSVPICLFDKGLLLNNFSVYNKAFFKNRFWFVKEVSENVSDE
jgi:Icc-related predicted phosphoesterase